MADKFVAIATYLGIGLAFALLLAKSIFRAGNTIPVPIRRELVVGSMLLALLFLLLLATPRPSIVSIVCACSASLLCIFLCRLVDRRTDLSSAAILLAIFCSATTLAWWRRTNGMLDISWQQLVLLHALLVAVAWCFVANHRAHAVGRHWGVAIWLAFLMLGAFVVFSTGLYSRPWALRLSWHHWGAYVGPAQLVLAGARVMLDFPAQYGLGPTLLLATTCHGDCWLAMYFWAGASTLLFGAICLSIALRLTSTERPWQLATIALAVFIAAFLWTAYPPNIGSPALTPSVSGLRFLPLGLLMSALVRGASTSATHRPSELIHLLWVFGLLWSPESAFQVTVLWWPYYCWAACRNRKSALSTSAALAGANARLIIWLSGTIATVLLIYKIAYGSAPSIEGYLAYLLYPPGLLPINPYGALLFFGAVVLAATYALHRGLQQAADSRQTHNLIIVLLACYGASSYYLGRSHDNNLLNISVFYLLLLLALRQMSPAGGLRIAASGFLACLLAYITLTGWSTWREVAQSGAVLQIRPRETVSHFSYLTRAGQQASTRVVGQEESGPSSGDGARGMLTIAKEFGEPVTVLDTALNLEGSASGAPWSALHGPENYAYLPPTLRRMFLAKVVQRLKSPGWLLIQRDFDAGNWLDDYDAVYRRDQERDFGTYYAIRYVPK